MILILTLRRRDSLEALRTESLGAVLFSRVLKSALTHPDSQKDLFPAETYGPPVSIIVYVPKVLSNHIPPGTYKRWT